MPEQAPAAPQRQPTHGVREMSAGARRSGSIRCTNTPPGSSDQHTPRARARRRAPVTMFKASCGVALSSASGSSSASSSSPRRGPTVTLSLHAHVHDGRAVVVRRAVRAGLHGLCKQNRPCRGTDTHVHTAHHAVHGTHALERDAHALCGEGARGLAADKEQQCGAEGKQVRRGAGLQHTRAWRGGRSRSLPRCERAPGACTCTLLQRVAAHCC